MKDSRDRPSPSPSAPRAGAAAEERRKRQAEALRANLRRRKAAQRDEAAAKDPHGGRSGFSPARG